MTHCAFCFVTLTASVCRNCVPLSWTYLDRSGSYDLIHVSHSAGVSTVAVYPDALSWKEPDALEVTTGPALDEDARDELLSDLYAWQCGNPCSYKDVEGGAGRVVGMVAS